MIQRKRERGGRDWGRDSALRKHIKSRMMKETKRLNRRGRKITKTRKNECAKKEQQARGCEGKNYTNRETKGTSKLQRRGE